jgi:MGT family glycosyltransferase
MPKALFFNVPGHGHVNPSLPLVAELIRRRHYIIYFATEGYRARIEATGAGFQPYSTVYDDYFDSRGLSGSVPQRVACQLITTADEILPELLDIARIEQPDYIIFDGMCPWGYLVARILDLPSVASLSLMPLMSPPPSALLNIELLRALVPMMFRDFDKGLEANKRAQMLTKKYSIPPLGLMSIMNGLGDISISYTSSYFQPYANRVADTVRFVGRTINDSPAIDSFPFEQAQGRRITYISLGTVNNEDAGFFRMCIEAFADSDDFVIMTTGNRISPESFGTLPKNISIHAWVPQVEILKRAALFITHGGMNSVHDGLYFGVPLLLIPQQSEQTVIALRVVELGAGLMLKKSKINPQTIHENAARLLTNAHFKVEANHIGDTLRAAGGVTRAADEIEALLRKSADSKVQ